MDHPVDDNALQSILDRLHGGPSESHIKDARSWIRSNPDHPRAVEICHSLVWNFYSPANVQVARQWFKSHSDHPSAGSLISALVVWTHSRRDIESAKDWLRRNDQHKYSAAVFEALVAARDPESIERAKYVLRKETASARFGLVSVLLHVCPEEEMFELTRRFLLLRRPPNGGPVHVVQGANKRRIDISAPILLMNLLHLSPTQENLEFAFRISATWIGSPVEPNVLATLWRINPRNKAVLKQAKIWCREHPDHEEVPSLRSLGLYWDD